MSCGRGFRGKPPLYPPTASNLYKRLNLAKVIRYNNKAEKKMTNIEMQTMNSLQNFCREYRKQNSFLRVEGFTPVSEVAHTYYIKVSGIKGVEALENGNHEILFDSAYLERIIVSDEEFLNKIMPIL